MLEIRILVFEFWYLNHYFFSKSFLIIINIWNKIKLGFIDIFRMLLVCERKLLGGIKEIAHQNERLIGIINTDNHKTILNKGILICSYN